MNSQLADHLLSRAAATGQIQRASLPGGLAVALLLRDGVATVTISRRHGRVRDAELIDVRQALHVPAGATRFPADPLLQAQRPDDASVRYVAFRFLCTPSAVAHAADDEIVADRSPTAT
jgi:hypothetical protein